MFIQRKYLQWLAIDALPSESHLTVNGPTILHKEELEALRMHNLAGTAEAIT
jgi:hypothetical protein